MAVDANSLRALRLEAELSPRELAALTGVNHVTILRIENGEVEPQMRTARKLAGHFGLKVSELFPKEVEAA